MNNDKRNVTHFNMLMPVELRNFIKETSREMDVSESMFVREVLKSVMNRSKSNEQSK